MPLQIHIEVEDAEGNSIDELYTNMPDEQTDAIRLIAKIMSNEHHKTISFALVCAGLITMGMNEFLVTYYKNRAKNRASEVP